MGLRQAWKALFSGDSKAAQSAHGLLAGITPWTTAPRRDAAKVLRAYKELPYLHALSRRIAEEVASVPFQVLGASRGKGGRVKALSQARGQMRQALLGKAVKAGDLTPLDAHPFLDVLAFFNPSLGAFESRVASQLHADFLGQAPMVRENDEAGRCIELHPIPPTWVAEMPRPGSPFYRVAKGSWNARIPEDGMVWGRVVDPEEPYGRGTSYGEAMAGEIDVVEGGSEFLRSFMKQGARPAGIVAIEGAGEDMIDRIEGQWEAKYGGPKKAGRTHFTNGRTSFTPITPTLQQLEMSALREEARRIFQEIYGMPPELVGVLENSNRSTIDSAYYLMARGLIVPRMERWCSWLQPLLDQYGSGLVLSYENPIPEDEVGHRAHMASVPTTATVNEHRKAQGLAPIDGLDGEVLYSPPTAAPTFPVGLALPEPAFVKSLPRPVAKSAGAVATALEALRPARLTAEVEPVASREFQRWAEQALRQVGVAVSFDMKNPLVLEALEKSGKRVVGINETTRETLAAALNEGVAAGEGIRELANRVDDVMTGAAKYRAERIARTETVGLSNAANFSAYVQSGVVEGKEWVSVNDGTQDEREHEKMNGQRVGLMEDFRSPLGHKAQHPGGFGVAEEDINCRCVAVPVVADPDKAVHRAALPPDVARERAVTEDALATAFRRAFEKQKADVLAALRSAG